MTNRGRELRSKRDVQPGSTPQSTGKPLPLALSSQDRQTRDFIAVPRTATQLPEQGDPRMDGSLDLSGRADL